MIDVKVTTIGGERIARQFDAGPGALRVAVMEEIAPFMDGVVSHAQANAPKRSGIMAGRVLWYFGNEATRKQQRSGIKRFGGLASDFGPVIATARPTGSVAHLMERGVKGPRKAHFRRETRVGTVWTRKGKRTIRNAKGRTWVNEHPFHIAPHPFFMPAVDAMGGGAALGARLQAAMARAGEMMKGAA